MNPPRMAPGAPAALPIPGLVWGPYPQHPENAPRAAPPRANVSSPAEWLPQVRAQQASWASQNAAEHDERLYTLRAHLARDGWAGGPNGRRAEALGCVAAALQRTLARDPFDTQLIAADMLLDDRLAEMATGEGKTVAAALASAVAALAGVPVHVMTANDYLVQRDADTLRPFYAALGLRVGSVTAGCTPEQRRAAYACDLTYATAREVAFDHLRDGLNTAPPLLRGLCMAVLDEADSLLIDEATMPLVLSEAADDAAQRAACFQALALARQLQPGRDVLIDSRKHAVVWQPDGEARLQSLSAAMAGAWHNRRHRLDLVGAALEALHLLQRDRDYLVRDGRLELLDPVTGRAAPGRVWSRGVHTLVELKEGVAPTPVTRTRAQISFQRFFPRYVRLCGMSGTLAECRAEIAALYARDIVPVPLRRVSQRRCGPDLLFRDAAARTAAVLRRVQALQAEGRPVLIGTDSVADSMALSARLDACGIAHRVLNARHDADEAAIVAGAGRRGAVTVSTRMAGRGTDITLGEGVAALGGLHVLSCQDNLSRRLDRQLIGRCARQGDPGSAEIWRALDAPAWGDFAGSRLWRRCRKLNESGALRLPTFGLPCLKWWVARLQRADERRHARHRRRLLERDREWERQLDFSRISG